MHQQNQPTASRALQRASDNQNRHTLRCRAYGRADEEDRKRSEEDGLAAPNVGELGPDGARGSVGEQEGGANPGVSRGGIEVG